MLSNATGHNASLRNPMELEHNDCQFDILLLIMKIQPILLIIFGFTANLFSFIVLIQPRLRRRPTFSYLAFLCLSNALLSLIHAFFTIIGVYFRLTLENLPLFFFCRLLNRFLIDFLTHFSLYTLTAVDLDRVRTVTSITNDQQRYNNPNQLQQFGCAKSFLRVCIIELSFVCVLFFLDLHWLTSYGYTASEVYGEQVIHVTMCTLDQTAGHFRFYDIYLTTILPVVELIVFGIMPFLISLLATIIILRHVSIRDTISNAVNRHLKKSRRRLEMHLSILLISLNCVFLLFTTPHNIYNVYVGQLRKKSSTGLANVGELCSVAGTQKSLDLLQQCYFMSTFFLCVLTNKRFREESYRLLKRCMFVFCRRKNTPNAPTRLANRRRANINADVSQSSNQNNLLTLARRILGNPMSLSEATPDDEPAMPLHE